jgi:hypothetical protein
MEFLFYIGSYTVYLLQITHLAAVGVFDSHFSEKEEHVLVVLERADKIRLCKK